MRIKASVEVVNRALCVHNVRGRARDTQASLVIGRKPGRQDNEVFLILYTMADRVGKQYSIRGGNLEAVFSRFAHEGKATLRFKAPPHDLCIKNCDTVLLKAFLNLVKKVLGPDGSGGGGGEDEELSRLLVPVSGNPTPVSVRQVARERTKLIITDKQDYPVTKSFPAFLTELRATGVSLRRMDSRVFKLSQLTVLDLSGNRLTCIDPGVAGLANLKELVLARNRIESIPPELFSAGHGLRTPAQGGRRQSGVGGLLGLRLLDLSHNQITVVPRLMSRLKDLYTLKLNGNLFALIPPQAIGSSLRILDVSDNPNLMALPSTLLLRKNKLGSLSACKIPKTFQGEGVAHLPGEVDTIGNVPYLVDIAVKAVTDFDLLRGMEEPPELLLPLSLVEKLGSVQKCLCGATILPSSCSFTFAFFDLLAVSLHATASLGGELARFQLSLCSRPCVSRFGNNMFSV